MLFQKLSPTLCCELLYPKNILTLSSNKQLNYLMTVVLIQKNYFNTPKSIPPLSAAGVLNFF